MTSIFDWSTTAGSNTTVAGVSIAEGMSPAGVNNAIRGMMADLKKWQLDVGGALTTAGSANAYTLTTNSAPAAYADGEEWAFVANFSCTGASTLNRDGIGAKAIRKTNRADSSDVALVDNDIRASGHYTVRYDASANGAAGAFILLNPAPIALDEANTWSAAQTFTDNDAITVSSSAPRIIWNETDQGTTEGYWRILASGGDWKLEHNSAAARDFSTSVEVIEIDQDDIMTIRAVSTAISNPVYINGSEVSIGSGTVDGVTLNQKHIQISNDDAGTLLMRRRNGNGVVADFYRDNTSVGSISVTTVATAYNTSSDGRLKTNEKPITDCGSVIDALNPVRFDWMHENSSGVGFIAQELAEVIPEAVTMGDSNPGRSYTSPEFVPWQIDYSKVVPYLAAEVKSLRARVAILERRP